MILGAQNHQQEKAAERDAYDIAYLLPFLAGQLSLDLSRKCGAQVVGWGLAIKKDNMEKGWSSLETWVFRTIQRSHISRNVGPI